MKYHWLASALGVCLFAHAQPAFALGCVSDTELEQAFGEQIRSRAPVLKAGRYADQPLCSGLTLAQHFQKMRDAAFPAEQQARQQRAEAARLTAQAEVAAVAQEAAAPASRTDATGTTPAIKPEKLVLTTAALGISLAELLDRIVYADSKSWMMNRYIRGSMRNARYLSGNKAKTTYVAQGDYAFTGLTGSAGWVKISVRNGELDCLEYWDQPGTCRRLYHSLSQQTLVSAAAGALSGGGSSGSGGSSIADDEEMARRRGSGSSPPPPPPPTPPIGGSGGLYGCASPPCW